MFHKRPRTFWMLPTGRTVLRVCNRLRTFPATEEVMVLYQ
jgi:hypothetical protein